MRIGVVGPATVAGDSLRRAIALLLDDPSVRQVIYLGRDESVRAITDAWAAERMDIEQFIQRGVELACHGSADEIVTLLDEERAARRLQIIRRLPESPARAIEMLDRWIVLAVHDKAVLTEEDIANAHVIVYGKAPAPDIKRFGPRCFFTPGPVDNGTVGMLELTAQGSVDVRAVDLRGRVILQEEVRSTTAKLVVTS
jgi:hypothetical protein